MTIELPPHFALTSTPFGRSLIATKDIDIGEIVLVERPFVGWIVEDVLARMQNNLKSILHKTCIVANLNDKNSNDISDKLMLSTLLAFLNVSAVDYERVNGTDFIFSV